MSRDIHVVIEEETYRELSQFAGLKGRTMSYVVDKALRHYMEAMKHHRHVQKRFSFNTGKRDVMPWESGF